MLDHIGFSTADLAHARAFYDAALKPLGISCLMEVTPEMTGGTDAFVGYGRERPQFWIGTGKSHAPGIHVAFTAESRAMVDAFYRAALAAGGRDNGPPGLRPTIARTITAPSCSTPTTTISRPFATSLNRPLNYLAIAACLF